jgi:hypothetical protein
LVRYLLLIILGWAIAQIMEVNQVVLFKMAWQTSKNTEVGYQENL